MVILLWNYVQFYLKYNIHITGYTTIPNIPSLTPREQKLPLKKTKNPAGIKIIMCYRFSHCTPPDSMHSLKPKDSMRRLNAQAISKSDER